MFNTSNLTLGKVEVVITNVTTIDRKIETYINILNFVTN